MKGSTARVLAAAFVLSFIAAACSGAAATTTSQPPASVAPATQPATTTVPPTTRPPETTTTAPPTTLSSEPVGDPAALQALAEQVALDSGIPFDEFFVPDITQADPEAALLELLRFSEWAFSTKPDTALVAVHTVDRSPAFQSERSNLDTYESNGWVGRNDPFVQSNINRIDLEKMPLTDAERDELPAGSVAFQFQSTSNGFDIVEQETGEIVSTVAPWSNRVFLIVISPTDVGWQEYWYLSVSSET